MDINNGEILSMLSMPDFDLNKRERITDKNYINRATKAIYELGSVFKTFTFTAGLNENLINADTEFKNIAGDPDLIEVAKEQIISQLKDQYYDIIFQAVCDKMNENYMFRENNYFTEAGMDEFEDAWFEWYHNHHGDILMAVLKDIGQ